MKQFVTQTGQFLGANAMGRVSSFLFAAFMARALTVHDFGVLVSILALGSIGMYVADFGLTTFTVGQASRHQKFALQIGAYSFRRKFLVSFAVILFGTIYFSIFSTGIGPIVPLLLLTGLAVGGSASIAVGLLQVAGRYQSILIAESLRSGVLIAYALSAHAVGTTLTWAGSLFLTANGLYILVASARVVKTMNHPPRDQQAWTPSERPMAYGIGLTSAGIIYYFDMIVLPRIAGLSEAALYGAAHIVLLAAIAGIDVVNAVLFPVLRKATRNGTRTLNRLFTGAALAVWIPAIVSLPFVWIGSRLAINLAFGPDYQAAGLMLNILWVGLSINAAVASFGTLLLARYGPVPWALTMMGGAIANVLLNLLLVPSLGGIGSATAFVISQIVIAGAFITFGQFSKRDEVAPAL